MQCLLNYLNNDLPCMQHHFVYFVFVDYIWAHYKFNMITSKCETLLGELLSTVSN